MAATTDPTAAFGLDLRQAVTDRLGPDSPFDPDQVLNRTRRAINTALLNVVLLHPDRVEVPDPRTDVATALRAAWNAIDFDAILHDLRVRTVTVTMSGYDFLALAHTSAAWGDRRDTWEPLLGNFETTGTDETASLHWARAYWVGDQWTAALLARAYLDAVGAPCQIVWDLGYGEDESSLVVLTDHLPEHDRQPRAVPTAAPDGPAAPGKELELGDKAVLHTEEGPTLCRIIGVLPSAKTWTVEIATTKHPWYRRGHRLQVPIGDPTLTRRTGT